jgi:alanine racemase
MMPVFARATGLRPTEAIVDLGAIRDNVRALMPPSAGLMAVVKADAYGHGAVSVARVALEAGAEWLGVALVEEGIELRDAGITAPVLVLTECPPGSERAALDAGLTPALCSREALDRLAQAGGGAAPPGVHVKVDTGMHRAGIAPDEIVAFCREVRDAGLRIAALWTHFATADEPENPFLDVQLDRFTRAVSAVRAEGIEVPILHAANSAATMLRPDTHFDLVRVGIAMYGVPPAPALGGAASLRPVMTVRSRVAAVRRVPAGDAVSYGQTYRLDRDSTIATVPIGYADGYPRSLSNRAEVLIGGRRWRVAGTVTMDQTLIDCGDDHVALGDEVVLLGRQGSDEITAAEVARRAGTIGYEVVSRVGARVPRRYVDA